jgi:hypothetical protein
MPREDATTTTAPTIMLADDEYDADAGIGFAFGGFMVDDNEDFDGKDPVEMECHWTHLDEVLDEYRIAPGRGGGRGGRGRGGGGGRGRGQGGGRRRRRRKTKEYLFGLAVHCGKHPEAPEASPVAFSEVFGALVAHLTQDHRMSDLCLTHANLWPPEADNGSEDDNDDNIDTSLQPSDQDLRALFGRILPSHPKLGGITLVRSRIHPTYLRLMTEALRGRSGPWWPGFRINLVETPLGGLEGCRLLHNALVRGYDDVAEVTALDVSDCRVGQDGFQMLCEGIAASRALFRAELSERTARVDASAAAVLARAVRSPPRSELIGLSVGAGTWSDEGFATIMEALKANSPTLEDLTLRSYDTDAGFGPSAARMVEELVRTYNYNLSSLELDPWPHDVGDTSDTTKDGSSALVFQKRIQALVRRNRRARSYDRRERNAEGGSVWPRRRAYEIKCRALWPRAMAEIGRFPSLLYKVLRKGNAKEFADQLEHATRQVSRGALPVRTPNVPPPAMENPGKKKRKAASAPAPPNGENTRNPPPSQAAAQAPKARRGRTKKAAPM